MDKIDPGYLYELGATLRSVKTLGQGNLAYPWQAWGQCLAVRDAVQTFIQASIYTTGLRSSHAYGQRLIDEINALVRRMEANEWPNREDTFSPFDTARVTQALSLFEPVMVAELQRLPIFLVPPRGAFDNAYLIESGEALFPDALLRKVPETLLDVQQAGKCIAFNLPTAAGFHLHRANEAVLRAYHKHVSESEDELGPRTMGTLLADLKKKKLGDPIVIASLDAIKEFHRNPLMHPDHTLADIDEAISLYCAIRSAISYMLESLPFNLTRDQAREILEDALARNSAAGRGEDASPA